MSWYKKAQLFSSFDELELGTTPTGEDCAQVGSKNYEYSTLARMELKAFYHQLTRLFPNPPAGVTFKTKSNPHDFGTYYDLAVKFDSNDEAAAEYAYNVENNTPEEWDAGARAELEAQGYFQQLVNKPKGRLP